MATFTSNYDTNNTITCTLTSLGDGGYRESAVVTNATDKFVDASVGGSIQVGTVTVRGLISIYAYASTDDGTTYSGGLAGTNETITWGTTPSSSSVNGYSQLVRLHSIDVDATDDNNDIEFTCPVSIAEAFGFMPQKWGIVVHNETGVALHATGTNNKVVFNGLKYDSA